MHLFLTRELSQVPSPVPTNVLEIGRACAARLVSLSAVPDASQIKWSARKGIEVPHIKGLKDLVIRPRRGQDIKSFEKGGQRYGAVFIRVIDFILRTSYGGSEASSDEAWLEQHVPFEDDVLNALAGQMLQNTLGEEYLTCPIHFLGATEEEREATVATTNLWGGSQMSFEFHYKPKLDLSQIA